MTLHTESILSLQERGPRRILMQDVLKVVGEIYHVSINEIRSPRRGRLFVRAKQAAYYLGRAYTTQSLSQIGRRMNKDHSTVIHGEKRVRLNPDKYQPELSKCIAELDSQCAGPALHTAPGTEGLVPGHSVPTHLRER